MSTKGTLLGIIDRIFRSRNVRADLDAQWNNQQLPGDSDQVIAQRVVNAIIDERIGLVADRLTSCEISAADAEQLLAIYESLRRSAISSIRSTQTLELGASSAAMVGEIAVKFPVEAYPGQINPNNPALWGTPIPNPYDRFGR